MYNNLYYNKVIILVLIIYLFIVFQSFIVVEFFLFRINTRFFISMCKK